MIYDLKGVRIVKCTVRNVSASGAQLELTSESELPPAFILALSHDGSVRRTCHRVWQDALLVGVRFQTDAADQSASERKRDGKSPKQLVLV
jgi:hypothetical protein